MESFNQSVFLYLNAPADAGAWVLAVARFLAEDLIWLVPAGLLFGWMCGSDGVRRAMLQATATGVVALVWAQIIGVVWLHPRPFMIGLGHTFLAHVPDASFPSRLVRHEGLSVLHVQHPWRRGVVRRSDGRWILAR